MDDFPTEPVRPAPAIPPTDDWMWRRPAAPSSAEVPAGFNPPAAVPNPEIQPPAALPQTVWGPEPSAPASHWAVGQTFPVAPLTGRSVRIRRARSAGGLVAVALLSATLASGGTVFALQ